MINKFLIRLFDIVFALLGLLVLFPAFMIISALIITTSKGSAFFVQKRVGKNSQEFGLLKFRTMYLQSDSKGLITVGKKDPRVTKIGHFLRVYKIDELPQLFNVVIGDMSLVGPRPEVRKYVDLYTDKQMRILQAKPGITDYASIKYANESEILGKADDPEDFYIKVLMPEKIELNLIYLDHMNVVNYFRIIFKTFFGR